MMYVNEKDLFSDFNARCYAERGYATASCLFVRLSACLEAGFFTDVYGRIAGKVEVADNVHGVPTADASRTAYRSESFKRQKQKPSLFENYHSSRPGTAR